MKAILLNPYNQEELTIVNDDDPVEIENRIGRHILRFARRGLFLGSLRVIEGKSGNYIVTADNDAIAKVTSC